MEKGSIYMEYFPDSVTFRDLIIQQQRENPSKANQVLEPLARKYGKIVGKMHSANIIHGDLTTSNVLIRGDPSDLDLILIDFGLSSFDSLSEDKGVDLYVLERAFLSSHPNTEELFEKILTAYKDENKKGATDIMNKLEEVRMRGRKRTMVG